METMDLETSTRKVIGLVEFHKVKGKKREVLDVLAAAKTPMTLREIYLAMPGNQKVKAQGDSAAVTTFRQTSNALTNCWINGEGYLERRIRTSKAEYEYWLKDVVKAEAGGAGKARLREASSAQGSVHRGPGRLALPDSPPTAEVASWGRRATDVSGTSKAPAVVDEIDASIDLRGELTLAVPGRGALKLTNAQTRLLRAFLARQVDEEA